MNCAGAITTELFRSGVGHLFLVPGAHVDPLVHALTLGDKVRGIICSHELGAAFMADGYARMREGFGACVSIGGPGAANLAPGAMTARSHGVPVLYLTGDTATTLRERSAFQKDGPADYRQRSLLAAAAGASRRVGSAREWPQAWRWAHRLLSSARPRPVHLSVPYDVQLASIEDAPIITASPREFRVAPKSLRFLRRALPLTIGGATRVAILAGRELNTRTGAAELLALAERFGIPVATTGDAMGLFPHQHPLHLGQFGYGGCPRAAAALLDPSLQSLLVIGAEWNERNTLGWDSRLERSSLRCLHLRTESKREAIPHPSLVGEPCSAVLRALAQMPSKAWSGLSAGKTSRLEWVASLRRTPLETPLPADADDCAGIHPARLVQTLRAALPEATTLFCDSGVHRLFAIHYWPPMHRLGFITAARTAPTGWAIAGAIGASFAAPGHPICALTGDGCMLMHGNELATAARYGAKVLFVVSNNSANGNIHRRMLRLYENGDPGLLPTVDWVAYARSFGVPATRVSSPRQLRAALRSFQPAEGPCLIEAITPREHCVPVPAHAFTLCDPEQLQRRNLTHV